ncbi:MAG: acylphosphatase [Bdellovibrionota bacterium]
MNSKAARLLISGRVQGVAFRAYTEREAQGLGVKGWVRNLPDGRVEAHLEGDSSAVEKMIAWCRQGPSHARVTGVEIEWLSTEGHVGFEIRY